MSLRSSQATARSTRARIEFTFQVAIRTGRAYLRPRYPKVGRPFGATASPRVSAQLAKGLQKPTKAVGPTAPDG
ncbi:hypothetical protein GCM10027456_09860 [Kineosporia babensis]